MYTIMINGFCKSGNVTAGIALWDEMRLSNVSPNDVAYNALLSACCKDGNLEKAQDLFREMLRKGFASTSHCSTLINGLCKSGKLQEAKLLLDDTMEKQIMSNNFAYTTLIGHHCDK